MNSCRSQQFGGAQGAVKAGPFFFEVARVNNVSARTRDAVQRFVTSFGENAMKRFLILTAFALSGLWLETIYASAQDRAIDVAKDLTVEAAKPAQRHPAKRRPGRPVQVSLMPIGASTTAIGEPLRFKMVSLANGYGHLYVLSASGRTQLWLENVRLRAGQPITFPRRGQIVRAAAPAGDETILFVASRHRFDGFAGKGVTTTPLDLQLTHEGLRTAIDQKFGAFPRNDWAFAEIKIRVRD